MNERPGPQAKDAAKVMKSIRRIVRAIDMRSKKVARETGLTIPQIVVLQAVEELGLVTTAALSKEADLSPATVVTILDKLESRGLVTRTRSASDRRIVHTQLTETGARMLHDAPPLFDWAFGQSFAGLPDEERLKILEAFATVADLLDAGSARNDLSDDDVATG